MALVVWAAVETTLNKIPIILKSHVKKSINLGGIYYIKILTGNRGDEVHEHLYGNGQRRVGHRILKKNTVTNK